jgi:hypothetical protein
VPGSQKLSITKIDDEAEREHIVPKIGKNKPAIMKMDSRISLGSHKIEQITPRSKNLPLKGGNYKNLTIKNPSFYSDDSLDQELNESSMKNSLRDS